MTLHSLFVLLLIVAAVCFLLAALSATVTVGHRKRPINLIAVGLLTWELVQLIATARN